jgi:hypothetical protein
MGPLRHKSLRRSIAETNEIQKHIHTLNIIHARVVKQSSAPLTSILCSSSSNIMGCQQSTRPATNDAKKNIFVDTKAAGTWRFQLDFRFQLDSNLLLYVVAG